MHTHSTFCGHAVTSLSDMVQAAEDAGVAAMAATEHYPLPESLSEYSYASMPFERLGEYESAVLAQRSLHPGMQILLGCELDWLGPDDERRLSPQDLSKFDIVLGSVHFIDGWLFNSSRNKDRWDDVDVDEMWERYVDLWCDAAASDMPYTVMSHPDVIKKFGRYPARGDLSRMYERMAEAAAAGGRMVEVNTSGGYVPCSEYYPSPDLLACFRRAGVRCTVGTDAHRAEHIARDIEKAYGYMYESGYREVAVPQVGGDVRMIPIE